MVLRSMRISLSAYGIVDDLQDRIIDRAISKFDADPGNFPEILGFEHVANMLLRTHREKALLFGGRPSL